MSQERWRRLEEIFAAAQALPPGRRRAFVEQWCQGDERLREAALELLAAGDEAGEFLGSLDQEAEPQPASFRPGQTLGAYRLGPILGQGGMSTVFRAERADGSFDRQVVVKVVRRGMESRETLGRLRQERRILAALEHPHIARLYDGGATEEHAPYFALEYIEGEPIDRYCDERGLSVAQRLVLLRQVCSAVAYAHRHLVVHRDLKPSNILVTEEGDVKLLDFGIAKLLASPEVSTESPTTAAWVRLLTPQYASPEQIRGEAVTTASDIYSLGVLLYRLLTGKLPFAVENRSLRQLEEQISAAPPPRPSEAVAARDRPEAAGPSPESAALRRLLAGDLDTIALRALQADPARRYSSVERLDDDLRRYLAGLPVLARGDSRAYRMVKFFRRHRLEAAAAAVIVALGAGQLATLARHGREMEGQRDRVTEAFERKAKAVELTKELFRVAGEGEALTVGEAVKRASTRLDRLFGDDPVVQGELLDTAGTIFLYLGAPSRAAELLSRAEEVRRRTFGADSLQRTESLSNLGVAKTFAASLEEDPLRAEQLAREGLEDARQAVAAYRQSLVSGDHRLVRPLNHLVLALCRLEEYAAAAAPSREAHQLASEELDEADPERARAAANRVSVLRGLQRPVDLLAAYREALHLLERAFGEEHPETSVMINNLGLALWRAGELCEAETRLRRAVAMTEALSGVDSPEVALPLRNLGSLLLALERPAEALRISSSARRILLAAPEYGPGYGLTAACTADVASALNSLDRSQEVPALLRRELELWRSRGAASLPRALLESALGESLALGGQEQPAAALLRAALEVLLEARGESHPDTRRTRRRLESLGGQPS